MHATGGPAARPTSRDVARAAGVSQSTVSLVLGGKWTGRVSPATAAVVQDAAGRLGYRPNRAARSLRLGTARTVLFLVPSIVPFFGAVYDGAARVAARHGFGVVLYPWPDGAGPAGSPFAASEEAIDGVLVSSVGPDVPAGFGGLPLVLLDSDPAGPVPTVAFAVEDGMRAVVAHLAALGHRRFGHVAAALDQWTFHARGAALAAAVDALPGGSWTRAAAALDVAAARDAAGALLDGPSRPTALVCDDDVMAAGAYKAARLRGLAVPGDVSVTGFDDEQLATALEPELTTVRLPAGDLGARGMTALLDLLDGRRPASVALPGALVVRASTAPPR
ncbi:LacI family DNA-binding transcriptional regulator [Actinomadura rayongensis]|uniref:Substrate-binding domain-containing protein n=1 Tax=Actinomadura rayongensis TaxID=1429076 RepID=A0A6I4WM58_9ACTN|nr:LacI family DNA-binding transcriptional regulator [Actinomadura rayongensis]MXQ68054.1 substrate-binding domain-containing protein [Actinomadura rayongensis]